MVGNVNTTKMLLDKFDLRAKKGFGQNFLIDENILSKIASNANLDKDTGVIEIGPGLGALTEHLLINSKKVLAYEIDSDMVEVLNFSLKDYDNLKINNIDFLKADLEKDMDYFSDCKCVKVVANLPYYITTAIITKLLESDVEICDFYFMVQKEVGDRLTSEPRSKDYGSLTVLMNYKAKTKVCFKVGRNCFLPAPEVESVIINVKPQKMDLGINNDEDFVKFIYGIFSQRRKTLVNNISSSLKINKDLIKENLAKCGLKETTRAEELDIEKIAQLYKLF